MTDDEHSCEELEELFRRLKALETGVAAIAYTLRLAIDAMVTVMEDMPEVLAKLQLMDHLPDEGEEQDPEPADLLTQARSRDHGVTAR